MKHRILTYAECFEIIDREFVSSKMEEGILKRASMAISRVCQYSLWQSQIKSGKKCRFSIIEFPANLVKKVAVHAK